MSEPIFRMDWLLRSPGLIRSAAVYSGFLIEDTLYFLRTGPGWQRLSGAYAAYNVVANPIIERQINKNREAHAAIAGWDFATEVPQRAEMAYRLTAIKSLKVNVPSGAGIAIIKLKANDGKPRSLTLTSQDYLGDPAQRERFFASIPSVEYT